MTKRRQEQEREGAEKLMLLQQQEQEDAEKLMQQHITAGTGFLQEQENTEKLMRRRLSNRESAKKSRARKEKHIQCLESEIKKLEYINNNLHTHIQELECVIRSKDAMILTLKEQTDLSMQVPSFETEYNLRRQLLLDVCQTTAMDVPHQMLAPLVREYNRGAPVDAPQISEFFLPPWDYFDDFQI